MNVNKLCLNQWMLDSPENTTLSFAVFSFFVFFSTEVCISDVMNGIRACVAKLSNTSQNNFSSALLLLLLLLQGLAVRQVQMDLTLLSLSIKVFEFEFEFTHRRTDARTHTHTHTHLSLIHI